MNKVTNFLHLSNQESVMQFFELRLEGFKAAHTHVELEESIGGNPNPYPSLSLEHALFSEGFDAYIKEFSI